MYKNTAVKGLHITISHIISDKLHDLHFCHVK